MADARDDSWPVVLDEVTGALDSLSEALKESEDLTEVLGHVSHQVTKAVPGVDEATVTLVQGGRARTAAGTSEIAATMDRGQYAAGAGPCLEAAASGHLVRASVEEVAGRWPTFAAEARTAGYRSFLSAPMFIDGDHAGAVNCYSVHEHGFAELDEKLLDLYTSAVTAMLRTHRRYQHARATVEQLRAALDTRAVIDQAKGILMAVRGISADEAFAVLVDESQRENIKVRDIAARFVGHATRDSSR